MFTSVRAIALTGFIGVLSTFVPGKQAEAGPFLDWLFRRRVLVYPNSPYVAGYPNAAIATVPAQTAYYPSYAATVPAQTVNYAPQTVIAGSPVASCPTGCPVTTAMPVVASPCPTGCPVTTASPVVAGYPAAAPVVAQPVVSGYAYTTYRTTWNRLPTTYYRPLTTYTAGYPAVTAQPCNTYTWQAQRVPTHAYRPWVPFVPSAPVTYGYAAQPAAVTYAPAAPNCCPTTGTPAATSPYYGSTIQGQVAPAAGFESQSTVPGAVVPGATVPADQSPVLPQGSFNTSPEINAPALQSVPDNSLPLMNVPTESASAQRNTTNSPYRVTPIPAPDVRTFGNQNKAAPKAPPLLNARERTVSNMAGQPVQVEQASWVTTKPVVTQPAAATKPAPKALWDDSGWRSASN